MKTCALEFHNFKLCDLHFLGESHETIINKIKKCGMNAAMAIKPKTPIDDKILSILDKNLLDMVLIMTVGTFSTL